MLGYPIIIYVQHLYLEFKSSVSTTIEKQALLMQIISIVIENILHY